jgi:ubiquinone/menaquinone biosynthesis C-methylase UbiE
MARQRQTQLAYSQLMSTMLDETHRRRKAAKMLKVLLHFLGREDLSGLRVVDLGCSAGYIADEMAALGARTVGIDIDVPGLSQAQERFGERVGFVCADGEKLPFADATVDVLIYNHIYEHVLRPDVVMAEIQRVLSPEGVVYLGLGNRLGVLEPHYRLPFLSYLPGGLADRYVRAFGRADDYHERFRTRPALRKMVKGLHVWDYSVTIVREPEQFAAQDLVPGPLRSVPETAWRLAMPLLPTYIWVGSPSATGPRGGTVAVAPTQLH